MTAVEADVTELQALEFINNVRARQSKTALTAMPEPTGQIARMTSAGIAMGCAVVRHHDNGPLYALLDEDKDHDLYAILVEFGCRMQNRCPKLFNGSTGFLVEVHLPRYLYNFAAPRKVWERQNGVAA